MSGIATLFMTTRSDDSTNPRRRTSRQVKQGRRTRPGRSQNSQVRPRKRLDRGQRRAYLPAYLRRLRPHRFAVAAICFYALVVAGLEMIEPLFMRYIVDRVLLDTSLDSGSRISRLHLAGVTFLVVVVLSKMVGALKDYRQKLLNVQVMLSLRRALYDRLLHLPLPKLWGMKTGGILSRLSGDIDTTTGLLQMAVVSPALSIVRLAIAIGGAVGAQLATGTDGSGRDPRRSADELCLRTARPADLSFGSEGRGGD